MNLSILVVLVSVAVVQETPLVLLLEPDSTRVEFELGATLHDVHGSARLTEGRIELHPTDASPQPTAEAPGREPSTRVRGTIVIDATSLETGNASRDKKMHRKVLESEVFPSIRLEIDGMRGTLAEEGPSEVVLVGQLELHGDKHLVEIPADVTRTRGEAGDLRLDFTARFEVPYVEWGLRDPSTFVLRVAKVVVVTVVGGGELRPASE